jgi:hypothetical protein
MTLTLASVTATCDHLNSNSISVSDAAATLPSVTLPATDSARTVDPSASELAALAALTATLPARNHRAAAKDDHREARDKLPLPVAPAVPPSLAQASRCVRVIRTRSLLV